MDYDYDYNNFTETFEPEEYYQTWHVISLNVLQGFGTTAGLLANAFLLVLFAATPHLRTVSSTLLLQRAIADVFDLIAFPFIIYHRANGFRFDQGTCISLNIFLHVGEVASHVLLMAFTLVSYQALYPQHYTHPYRRKTMIVTSTVAWVLAAAAGVAAIFGYSHERENCTFGPLYDSNMMGKILAQLSLLFVIPMVVVWVLVSVALPPPSSKVLVEPSAVGEGPNRRLLLGLASSFTVLHGLYWLVLMVIGYLPSLAMNIITPVAFSGTIFGEALNAILVICLSEELRGKAAEWLPSRHTTSVPLREM